MRDTSFAHPPPLFPSPRSLRPTTPVRRPPRRRRPSACTPAPKSRALIPRPRAIPALFSGPEAVLGLVLAAAALLVDFARDLARITSTRGPAPLPGSPFDVDESIAVLQDSLEAVKAALADTEGALDESMARATSAEAALAGLGNSRDQLVLALDQAAAAEADVARVHEVLAEERERRGEMVGRVGEGEVRRAEVERAVKEREREMGKLGEMVREMRQKGNKAMEAYESKESELREDIRRREEELGAVKGEKKRLEEGAKEVGKKVESVADEVSAATAALEETRKELERVSKELEEKQKLRAEVERETKAAVERSAEAERLKGLVGDMEKELGELQLELRGKDQAMSEAATESDELRSLLAAKDADLVDVSRKLESAFTAKYEAGGDPAKSDLSLQEIRSNLGAEQLAFSAEIAKADLARSDISETDVDPLERLKKEMNAEGNLMTAGLRKAETTVRREEHDESRKSDAVKDVLESISADELEAYADALLDNLPKPASGSGGMDLSVRDAADVNGDFGELDAAPIPVDQAYAEVEPGVTYDSSDSEPESISVTLSDEDIRGILGTASSIDSTESLTVSKQAQAKVSGAGAKPKKRRGRPRKSETSNSIPQSSSKRGKGKGSDSSGDAPKKKRGRPRKAPLAPA